MALNVWLTSLAGGVLIGLASAMVLLFFGRNAGISGIAGGAFSRVGGDRGWRLAFLAGLVGGGFLLHALLPGSVGAPVVSGVALPVIAGLLVGFGTRLGNGCTSGHGVCGLARASGRSLAATLTFMFSAALVVLFARHLLGGLS